MGILLVFIPISAEEALHVLGLLNMHRIRAKLIQSNDGFRLYNLAEIRFSLKQIDKRLQSSKIPDDVWNKAKRLSSGRGRRLLIPVSCALSSFQKLVPNVLRICAGRAISRIKQASALLLRGRAKTMMMKPP